MTGFEYKVVPAPMRGLKGKGIKGTPARFANALQSVMNELGADVGNTNAQTPCPSKNASV